MKTGQDWSRLLGRPEYSGPHDLSSVAGKRILITGAGGSIGSALARSIATAAPASLILLDASEQALYAVDQEFAWPHQSVLGSICDRSLLGELVRTHRPQIIVHAAAFKHVTVVEQNPIAGAANNTLGTATLFGAALDGGVEQLVLVSSDKAADPANMMGASKRMAELFLLAQPGSLPRLSIVRLGNVLGSRGSVVPLFRRQLAAGLPLTVTHPEVRRYFMSMHEAVAALIGALGQSERLLAGFSGEPVRVLDLAEQLIAESGTPSPGVLLTGLRPGDKLEETLIGTEERWAWPAWSPGQLRAIVSPSPPLSELTLAFKALRQAVEARSVPRLFEVVETLVPTYRPQAEHTQLWKTTNE